MGTTVTRPTDQSILERIKKAKIFSSNIDVCRKNKHFEEINEKISQWRFRETSERFDNPSYFATALMDDSVATAQLQIKRTRRKLFKKIPQYAINLKSIPSMPKNTGQVFVHWRGVDIHYPDPNTENSADTHIRNHIIVAHELGHVLLHCPCFYFDTDDTTKWLKGIKSNGYKPRFVFEDEVAAFRCAEWILSFIAKKCEEAEEAGIHTSSYLKVESEMLFNKISSVMKNHGYQERMPEYNLNQYSIAENMPVNRAEIF